MRWTTPARDGPDLPPPLTLCARRVPAAPRRAPPPQLLPGHVLSHPPPSVPPGRTTRPALVPHHGRDDVPRSGAGPSDHGRRGGRRRRLDAPPSPASPPPSRPAPAPGGAVGGLARVAPDLVAGEVPGPLADGPAQEDEVHHPPEQAPASHLTLPVGNASIGDSGAETRPSASRPNRSRWARSPWRARAGWSGAVGRDGGRGSGGQARGKSLTCSSSGNVSWLRKEGGQPPARLHIAGPSSRRRRASAEREETFQHHGTISIALVCEDVVFICVSTIRFHESYAPMGWSTSKPPPEGGG